MEDRNRQIAGNNRACAGYATCERALHLPQRPVPEMMTAPRHRGERERRRPRTRPYTAPGAAWISRMLGRSVPRLQTS
jgi:hypothetical protein